MAHKSNRTAHSLAERGERTISLTLDDVPLQPTPSDDQTLPSLAVLKQITSRLIKAITDSDAPAIGFVNEKRLHCYEDEGDRASILRMWLDAGIELGNHTFSHVAPEETSLTEYFDDVISGEKLVKSLLAERGMRLRYFRHPQLHTGPNLRYKTALERFLTRRGYTVSPVTVKHQGWIFAIVYAEAKSRDDHELMRLVADSYVVYVIECLTFFESVSLELFGREISQVLLLHANELNSDYLHVLLERISERGYGFVSMDRALEDPAYSLPDNFAGPKGPSWLYRWALTMQRELPAEPKEPGLIRDLFNDIQERSRYECTTIR